MLFSSFRLLNNFDSGHVVGSNFYYRPPGGGRLFDMKVLNAFMRTYFALFEKSRNNEGVQIAHL